jgi:hypothetical protein
MPRCLICAVYTTGILENGSYLANDHGYPNDHWFVYFGVYCRCILLNIVFSNPNSGSTIYNKPKIIIHIHSFSIIPFGGLDDLVLNFVGWLTSRHRPSRDQVLVRDGDDDTMGLMETSPGNDATKSNTKYPVCCQFIHIHIGSARIMVLKLDFQIEWRSLRLTFRVPDHMYNWIL